jgi:hypothetical protein
MFDSLKQVKHAPKLHKCALALLTVYSIIIFSYGIYGALNGSEDLKSFYETSELLIDKINPYTLTTDYIEREGYNISFDGLKKAGGISMYPPSTHIMFIPFYGFHISPELGQISWLLWNIVFLVIIFSFLYSRYMTNASGINKYLLICLMIGASATKTNFSSGQTALFSLAAFVLTLFFKDRSKWWAGIAFAVAVSKPSLMILFALYLLIKKEFKIVAIAFFTHLALTVCISAWLGESPVALMRSYFKTVALLTSQENALSFYYQFAGVSFKTIFNMFDLSYSTISLITLCLYASAAMYVYQKRDIDEIRTIGLIALLTIFVDYHQHYDFVILFILFPLLINNKHTGHKWIFFYYCCLLYLPNISRFNFFGFSTKDFFMHNLPGLILWQLFYTMLYLVLSGLYIKKYMVRVPGHDDDGPQCLDSRSKT